ncbi:MAG: hypothetical protein ACYCQI_02290 [Gammaproteobacteria bacterium]
MFQSRYPKSPFFKQPESDSDQSASIAEVKTHQKELIKGNVQGMFKLSNSRVLIEERRQWTMSDENNPAYHSIYILDLKDSSRIEIPCDELYDLEKCEPEELDFGYVEECLELTPDTLILRLRTNNCPYPFIQHCFVKLSRSYGGMFSLKDSPNLEFGHTTVLSQSCLVSLVYSEGEGSYHLDLFEYRHWQPELIGRFALQKPYHSLTALNANTLILGGKNGDVDIYQIKDNQLIHALSLTDTLKKIRNPAQSTGGDQFVRMIGKNRDILLMAERNTYTPESGLVSLWSWDAKSNTFTKGLSINKHKLTGISGLLELEDGEHFGLLDGSDAMFLNTQLQPFNFPYATGHQTFIDFPDGCALCLTRGKIFKFQLDYRAAIKSQVDESTPLAGFGELSRYVAEYACLGDTDEEKPLQATRKM